MGADLYINGYEVGKMNTDNYFRDSYNGSNVLWTLNLSWWNDVTPMLKNGELKGKNLIKFRDMVVNAKQVEITEEYLKEKFCSVSESGEDSIENWEKYFTTKRQELIEFLNKAIELKQPIDCSL